MGREIRRVIPEWHHPRQRCPHSPWAGGCEEAKRNGGQCYQPIFDCDYEAACAEWYGGIADWRPSEHCRWYHEWNGNPPEEKYYRPKWNEGDATWFQVYETVSEGTPVTPPFATKEDLIEYLVKFGDFWDQNRKEGGWSRANAERFVEREWAPSLMATVTTAGAEIKAPRDGI